MPQVPLPRLAGGGQPFSGGRIRQRLGAFDGAAALIRLADHIETGLSAGLRWLARTCGRHGLGLTAGLAWRGLAALAGIGMAAALVTGLSADGDDTRRTSLPTETGAQGAQDLRRVRDVRQEPRAIAFGSEGWVRIAKPIAQFGLESPELDRQPPTYEARRSADGASREDTLTFGGFTESRPHLLMRLLTGGSDSELSQPFIIGLVRQAALRGMSVQRSGAPTTIETKFGPVETADATLNDGETSRACIGFRHGGAASELGLSGWWCGTVQRPADRQQLICLVERLDLLSAGDDRSLRATFARTELNRQSACLPPRLSNTGRKTSWLDADGRAPPLKTAARR
ncbi:hypothetical protein [Bosea sp. PAMC 26642]|uniref:hypothetical protein n=1 Tax=Bosea sp. (strain PAMC 26642) TaxID=1792307 RepID=UPI0012E92691|nr:hypothetical protein [Bosea sp. PAMC 26642]